MGDLLPAATITGRAYPESLVNRTALILFAVLAVLFGVVQVMRWAEPWTP